jgi:hypothetical protein
MATSYSAFLCPFLLSRLHFFYVCFVARVGVTEFNFHGVGPDDFLVIKLQFLAKQRRLNRSEGTSLWSEGIGHPPFKG